MANKRSPKKRRPAPKTILRLPDLDQAKSAVLNSLSSGDAQRGYRHAIDEFVDWCCSEPRLSFSRTLPSAIACISNRGSWLPELSIYASGPCGGSLTRPPIAVCSALIGLPASGE
jgi:hypothetical protein